jgi:hypothetical protein
MSFYLFNNLHFILQIKIQFILRGNIFIFIFIIHISK